MRGLLLTWQMSILYWFPFRLMLLEGLEDKDFRHSSLWKPSELEVYGDKEVCHRKMQGSVEPYITTDLPWPWSGHEGPVNQGYWGSGLYRYSEWLWQSGGTHTYSFGATWVGKLEDPSYQLPGYTVGGFYERKLVEEPDTVYMYMRGFNCYSDELFHDFSVLPDLDVLGIEWQKVGWKVDIYGHPDPNGSWRDFSYNYLPVTVVDFELHDSVPYYWREYMETIRPHESSDDGALSEVIRNTITENTTLNTNNYANLIEIIDTIKDFRNGKVIELVEDAKQYYNIIKETVGDISGKNLRTLTKSTSKKAANAWLAYRYAYSTTKSDVEQFAEAQLGNYLGNLTPDRVLRGKIKITNGELRVKMRLHDDTTNVIGGIMVHLNQYGLMPSLYNLWDMVPFSFVVDWFSDLGDLIQDFDERWYFTYYKVDELLVSRKQTLDKDEIWGTTHYTWYDRNLLLEMPQWEIYEDPKGSSTKTIVKRCLDGVSIAMGFVNGAH